MLNLLVTLAERGKIPDPLLRLGIQKLCSVRLKSLTREHRDSQAFVKYIEMLKSSPVAVETQAANEQHYEVPAEFYKYCLGANLKYSCAFWEPNCQTLDEAERRALEITIERADIKDGMRILELGCGWGSLSLAMAKKFPLSQIVAVSNSGSQREFIMSEAKQRGLPNLEVLTRDVSVLQDVESMQFDRVVSVEMFEHLRNYPAMLARIKNWLAPNGKLFIHIFTHQKHPYLFETEGSGNWMGKYFFTGGQMPSRSLLAQFQDDLKLENQWEWDGTHYQKTSEAWLENMDDNRNQVLKLFEKTYGKENAVEWVGRWRMFYLAVAELFGYAGGNEWGVTHYLFSRGDSSQ